MKQQKDYEATFAALQSTYGFGGTAPVLPALTERKAAKASKAATSHATPVAAKSGAKKDYEAAYATLSSSYGFGGAPAAQGFSLRAKA